uniref:CCHC-type domain-containing protein n=1 Tax=Cacopsylla melanoneura TaxID=428564 RepID=A0A8D8QI66_9HEMI
MAGWKNRYNVNRLNRTELEYELQIRSKQFEKADKEDILRSALRAAIKEFQGKGIETWYTKSDAKAEFKLIESGIEGVREKLKDCTSFGVSAWDAVATKFVHYSCRLNRILVNSEEKYDKFDKNKSLLQETIATLEAEINVLYEKQQPTKPTTPSTGQSSSVGSIDVQATTTTTTPTTQSIIVTTSSTQSVVATTCTTQTTPSAEVRTSVFTLPTPSLQNTQLPGQTGSVYSSATLGEQFASPRISLASHTLQQSPLAIQTRYNLSNNSRLDHLMPVTTTSGLGHLMSGSSSSGPSHLRPAAISSGQGYFPVVTMPYENPTPSLVFGSHQNSGNAVPEYQGNFPQVKVKAPSVTTPNFDGKKDVEEFLKEFNLAASVNNWTNSLKCKYIALYLKGSAKTLFENRIEDRGFDWGQTENILRSYFTPIGNDDLLEHKMRSRVQDPLESVEQYMQDKLHLINKFDRYMHEDQTSKLVMYGLLPDVLARVSLMEGNNTVDGLRTNVQKVEIANHRVNLRIKGIQNTPQNNQVQPTWATDLINVVRSIEEKSNNKQNHTNKDHSLHRELQELRSEVQYMKSRYTGSPHGQYQPHQYQPHQHQDTVHRSRRENNTRSFQSGFNEPRYNSRERGNSRYRKVDSIENSPRPVSPRSFERTSSGRLVKCYACGTHGHIARFCPSKLQKNA